MADDQVTYEVITEYTSKGQPKSLQEVHEYQDALNNLFQAGKVSESQFRKSNSALNKLSASFGSGTGNVSKYSSEFKALVDQLDTAQEKFRSLAQDMRSAGSLTPTKDAGASLSLKDARELIATDEARRASVLTTARAVVSAHDQEVASNKRLQASIKEGAAAVKTAQSNRAYEKELAALTPLEAATRRVADARRELYNANRQVSRAQDSGNLEKQTQALGRQEKAVRSAASAEATLRREQENSAKATQDIASNLPRLRYALYDVSNAAGIFGAAVLAASVGTAALAISMDRDFADVRRTTGATGFAARELQADFESLFTSLPVKWNALTQIGALAGQLNIATSDVAQFTDLVAKFSATTDVSVEQSATAFGRLAQLLNVSSDDYDRLGSSILKVGVNSVATESQIIAISTQIAGIARQANFSADEVFGLSAAMASLGIQPELARGTITRLFTRIEVAASTGGASLDKFAAISGRTASQFRQDWGTDSSGVLVDMLKGLDQVTAGGGNAVTALRELGITSVRDVPALLRMAQGSQMVADALKLSAEGWTQNTELNNQFAVVADTVSAKLETIANKGQLLVATLGESAAGAQIVVGALGLLLDIVNNLAKSPWVSGFAGAALVLGVVVGAVSLLAAGLLRGLATMAAFRTAQFELTKGTGTWAAAIQSATGVLYGNTTAVLTNSAAIQKLSVAQKGFAASGAIAEKGTNKFTSALGKGGLIGSLILAIPLVYELASATASWISNGVRDMLGLNKSVAEYEAHLKSIAAGQGGTGLTGTIENQLKALGSFGGGFGLDDFILQGPSAMVAFQQLEAEAQKMDTAFAELAKSGQAAFVTTQLQAYIQALVAGGATTEEAKAYFQQTFDTLGNGALVWDQLGEATNNYVEGQKESLSAILDPIGAANKLESALESLGNVYRESGADAAASSDQMAAAIQQVFDMDPSNAANNLQLLFQTIVDGGYASASQLIVLQQAIAALGGATGTASLRGADMMSALAAGATKAGAKISKAAGGAAKSVRTLIDYANDLAKVWKRAFDIRFGASSAMDDITTAWRDLNDEIADYQQKVAELTADKNIKEYFLSVAEAYNDTLRAGKLRAEIGDIDNQLADATAGASKSLTGNSKAAITNRKRLQDLVGGYQDYLQALAASGASQATVAAAVQKSKSDFIAQATALGYATTELKPYVATFNDMATVVARVPRNITVSANINPALQALNEFVAAASKAGGAAGSALGTNLASTYKSAFERYMRQRPIAIQGYLLQGQQVYRVPGTQLKLYDSGGYTGPGGKMEPAGIVHRGEYVVPKKYVNQSTGLPYADAMGRLQAGLTARNSYAGGGFVRGGSNAGINIMIPSPLEVELSGGDRRLLQAIGGSGDVYMSGEKVTGVVNDTNTRSSRRGQ